MGFDGSAPGAARLHLVDGVPLLRPEEQVFAAMLAGFANQQLARNLARSTIEGRENAVKAFSAYVNAFPWQWSPAMIDEWLGDLRSLRDLKHTTIRAYSEAVRSFKAKKGSPPKRRSVLTVWDWTPEILDEWFTEIRPLFAVDNNPAAWPSERGLRVGCQRLNSRFVTYRETLGLDSGLDFHSFRRSYVTHLIEAGRDPRFVQEQVGHEHASTTSIYTCVSSDFRTRTLRRALDAAVAAALEGPAARSKA